MFSRLLVRGNRLRTPFNLSTSAAYVLHRYYLHTVVTIGPNCPGISGTVTDFFCPSRIPNSLIIVPEVEERRAIKPLVAQVLVASLAVYGVLYV